MKPNRNGSQPYAGAITISPAVIGAFLARKHRIGRHINKAKQTSGKKFKQKQKQKFLSHIYRWIQRQRESEKERKEELRNGSLSGTIGSSHGLVNELLSLSASDLHLHAGALVHLYVWLLRLLQRPNLRLYRLHQVLQLNRHHYFPIKPYAGRIRVSRIFGDRSEALDVDLYVDQLLPVGEPSGFYQQTNTNSPWFSEIITSLPFSVLIVRRVDFGCICTVDSP